MTKINDVVAYPAVYRAPNVPKNHRFWQKRPALDWAHQQLSPGAYYMVSGVGEPPQTVDSSVIYTTPADVVRVNPVHAWYISRLFATEAALVEAGYLLWTY